MPVLTRDPSPASDYKSTETVQHGGRVYVKGGIK
jgi:hypothetical protein